MLKDPLREEWAERIRFTRKHHDLSQEKFGRLLGVTGQTVSLWERGIRLPAGAYRSTLMRMFAQAEAARTTEENGTAV